MLKTITLTKERFLNLHFVEKCIVLETIFLNETFGDDTDIDFWFDELFKNKSQIEIKFEQ